MTWNEAAELAIHDIALTQFHFTAEDVWLLMDQRGVQRPVCGSEMAAALKRAMKLGWCVKTEERRLYPRNRPGKNDFRPVFVWESHLAAPPPPAAQFETMYLEYRRLYGIQEKQLEAQRAETVNWMTTAANQEAEIEHWKMMAEGHRTKAERWKDRAKLAEGRLYLFGIADDLDEDEESYRMEQYIRQYFTHAPSTRDFLRKCRSYLTFTEMMRFVEKACRAGNVKTPEHAVNYAWACCNGRIKEMRG